MTTKKQKHNFKIFYVKSYKYFLKINKKCGSERITQKNIKIKYIISKYYIILITILYNTYDYIKI